MFTHDFKKSATCDNYPPSSAGEVFIVQDIPMDELDLRTFWNIPLVRRREVIKNDDLL